MMYEELSQYLKQKTGWSLTNTELMKLYQKYLDPTTKQINYSQLPQDLQERKELQEKTNYFNADSFFHSNRHLPFKEIMHWIKNELFHRINVLKGENQLKKGYLLLGETRSPLVTKEQFRSSLQIRLTVTLTDAEVAEVFAVFDPEETGIIPIRDFIDSLLKADSNQTIQVSLPIGERSNPNSRGGAKSSHTNSRLASAASLSKGIFLNGTGGRTLKLPNNSIKAAGVMTTLSPTYPDYSETNITYDKKYLNLLPPPESQCRFYSTDEIENFILNKISEKYHPRENILKKLIQLFCENEYKQPHPPSQDHYNHQQHPNYQTITLSQMRYVLWKTLKLNISDQNIIAFYLKFSKDIQQPIFMSDFSRVVMKEQFMNTNRPLVDDRTMMRGRNVAMETRNYDSDLENFLIKIRMEINEHEGKKDEKETDEDRKKNEEKRTELSFIEIKSDGYQVIARIIEARDLKVENLDGTPDPVVYIEGFGQKPNTQVIKGDLDKETFEKSIIRVSCKHAGLLGTGACAVDDTLIYTMNKDHEFYRQWVPLMLMDDTHPQDVGVQGYLKLSTAIVGPGEKARIHDEDAECATEIAKEIAAGSHISSLFLHAPTTQKWKYVGCKVCKCDGLPVMDGKLGIGVLAAKTAAKSNLKEINNIRTKYPSSKDSFARMLGLLVLIIQLSITEAFHIFGIKQKSFVVRSSISDKLFDGSPVELSLQSSPSSTIFVNRDKELKLAWRVLIKNYNYNYNQTLDKMTLPISSQMIGMGKSVMGKKLATFKSDDRVNSIFKALPDSAGKTALENCIYIRIDLDKVEEREIRFLELSTTADILLYYIWRSFCAQYLPPDTYKKKSFVIDEIFKTQLYSYESLKSVIRELSGARSVFLHFDEFGAIERWTFLKTPPGYSSLDMYYIVWDELAKLMKLNFFVYCSGITVNLDLLGRNRPQNTAPTDIERIYLRTFSPSDIETILVSYYPEFNSSSDTIVKVADWLHGLTSGVPRSVIYSIEYLNKHFISLDKVPQDRSYSDQLSNDIYYFCIILLLLIRFLD